MQIAAFLGVVGTVIMGVSHRDRDLIMGLVNVILFLAFQQPDGILQSCHEDIISEMPQSVNAALVKLDLNSRTTIYAVCPAYHSIYMPTFQPGSVAPVYAEYCTNHPHPESAECGEALLR